MYTRNLSADSAASSINRSSSLLAFLPLRDAAVGIGDAADVPMRRDADGVTVIYFPFLLCRTSFQGAPQPPPARGVPGSRFDAGGPIPGRRCADKAERERTQVHPPYPVEYMIALYVLCAPAYLSARIPYAIPRRLRRGHPPPNVLASWNNPAPLAFAPPPPPGAAGRDRRDASIDHHIPTLAVDHRQLLRHDYGGRHRSLARLLTPPVRLVTPMPHSAQLAPRRFCCVHCSPS